jgi:4a-hydroxytetrahydrobiopterin dehydratase
MVDLNASISPKAWRREAYSFAILTAAHQLSGRWSYPTVDWFVHKEVQMATSKATDQEIRRFIDELGTWTLENDKLHREYAFRDFVQAFGFMTQAALLAERAAHHPEWFNVYNRVVVDLTTHEANGITEKDFELARSMEQLADSM